MSLPRLVGVIQLPPLAGSPRASNQSPTDVLQEAGLFAVREAQVFAQAGFDGVLLENSGDSPYYSASVPAETVASLAIIAAAVREAVTIHIGIQVLANDAYAALAIAAVTGCDFIRIYSEQNKRPVALFMRERIRLNAAVDVFTDGNFVESDGIILNSARDGEIFEATCQETKDRKIPLYLELAPGHDHALKLSSAIHGIIIGSDLRKAGEFGAPLEVKKVKEFAQLYSKARRSKKSHSGKTKAPKK
jgi:predicted TIM-barrel enzyme